MSAAAALLSATLARMALGALAPGYDVSLRTEGRAVADASMSSVREAEALVEVVPSLGLVLADRVLRLESAYYPRLLLTGAGLGRNELLHRARLGANWTPGRFALVSTLQGAYGTNDLLRPTSTTTTPSGTPVSPVQPLPGVTTLEYMSAEAAVAVEGPLASGLLGRVGGAGFVDGGATWAARRVLPLGRGGRGRLGLDWTVTHADVLATALTGSYLFFGEGRADTILSLTEQWRHAFSPRLQGSVAAGPSLTGHRPGGPTGTDPAETTWRTYLTAEASGHAELVPRRLDAAVTLRMTPIADRVTTAVYQRWDVLASAAWRPARTWVVAADASTGLVLEGPQSGEAIYSAELRATWLFPNLLDLVGGVRWFKQDTASTAVQPTYDTYTVFLAVTVRQRDRF
jgi:hypothetical protein